MGKLVEGTDGKDIIIYPFATTSGDDTVYGYGGDDQIGGGDGDDTILGGSGIDHIYGEDDNDTLKGGGGADIIIGGDGIDTAAYGDSPAAVTVSLLSDIAGGGDATGDNLDEIENLLGSAHADTLWGDNLTNVLNGQAGSDELKGWGGDDILWGGYGHDVLYGMEGVDDLYGEDGNDYLNGGGGADDMIGGIGNDIYIVDHAVDEVFEAAGQGNDIVRTSVSWTMTAGASIETLETLNAAGTALINLTGNNIGNHLIGNNGHNVLDGGGGMDHMTGHGGNDMYYVDNTGDWVTESGGGGMDEVRTTVSWTLTAGADVETLRAVPLISVIAINLTGNETGNVVIGNFGNNVLNGGAGNDELTGQIGEDSFRFDTQLDADTNRDEITDFNVMYDTILLDDAIFSAFANGPLAAERFVVGAAAQDASDNIIYNSATGAIYYDSDGSGAAAAVQFAQVTAGLALTHLDFAIV